MSRTPGEPHGGTGTARERLSDLAETIGAEKLNRYQEVLAQLEPRQLDALVARLERAQSWDQVAKVVGQDSADDARATVTEALCGLAGAEGSDLEGVALAVADRSAIDWPARLDQAKDEHERDVLEQLRLADEVAEACWTQPTSPKRLGDFEILRELGRGGMGVVYEARQVSLNRRVALKVLPPGLGLTGQAVRRFEREAHAAAKLHHTNIVPVHATGKDDGCHYYAMELIEGQSLSEVLKDLSGSGSNPLMDETVTKLVGGEQTESKPDTNSKTSGITSLSDTQSGGRRWFDAVAKLIAEVADALEYAHGRGVIHRDIKPANLMLSNDGKLCVTDFGLARVAQEPGMTVSGSLMGTPAYMSPEQIASGRMKLDHRTDVYSLGAVLYEMLAHQRPFPGDNREQILGGILTKDPKPPRRFNPRIPLDLETICLKAMEKDPDKRYATAGEFGNDLRQFLQRGLITARRASLPQRVRKSIRRHPVAATVVVGVLVVAVASVVAWQWGGRGKEAERLVADARLALREGTYRDGLQLVDRALELDPDSIDSRLVRARLLIMNSRNPEAADEARSVLQTDPQNHAAHAILATLALYYSAPYRVVTIDPEPHLRVVEANAPDSAEAYYLRAIRTVNTREKIGLLDRALDLNPADALASTTRMFALGRLKDFQLYLAEADRLIAVRPKSAQGWRFKAYAYREQQDFESARSAIERALSIDDLDPHNYSARASLSWDEGRADEALSDRTRQIKLHPQNGWAYSTRTYYLNTMGRFEEAVADGRKCIELNPDLAWCYRRLIPSYLSLNQEDDVRATLERYSARAESWFDAETKANAYRDIADYYRQLKDYDRALEAADRAIEIDPEHFRGFIRRMRIHRELGDDDAAEADCLAAASIEMDEPAALSGRGFRLLFDCHEHDRAIEDFNRVIELAPRWHEGYSGRGTAQLVRGRYGDALADLDRAIELAPYHNAYTNRAMALANLDRYQEALADEKRALELQPNNSIAWGNYASSLERMGRVEEALAAVDKALELNPRFAYGHASRAGFLADLSRCEEAVAELKTAEELAPTAPMVRGTIAWVILVSFYHYCPDRYDLAEGLRHARIAYEAQPEFQREVFALALFRKGDYAEARRILTKLVEEEPDWVWFRFELAMALWHLGERDRAREIYDRAVTWMEERFPEDPALIPSRQEAAELLGIQSPDR